MISVIFDMDGTLLDTQRICIPAWEWAGNNQGIKNMGEHLQFVCGMNRTGSDGYITANFPGLDLQKFRKDEHEYIKKHGKTAFKPGGEELLNFLKQNGVRVALATGTSRPSVEKHLKTLKIQNSFDAVVCGGEVKNGKPAPDIFLHTAKMLGANRENCFVFEDSPNGIKAGFKAGMKCIGVPDVVRLGEDIKKLMFAELTSLKEAIPLLKPFLE